MTRPALACLLLLASLSLPACAQSERLVELQVQDQDNGVLLPQYRHRGRDYLEGQPGHRFALQLRNLTGERVLAVVSVDGVNVVSGQTAATSQAGYVLEPWQRIDVAGWRKSYSDIAEFYFTDLPDSYAARTGRPDNVGVIGVAAFRERRPAPIAYEEPAPNYRRDQAPAANSAGAARAASAPPPADLAAQELGTGHGERRYDPVSRTEFERDSARPRQVLSLFYDSYQALLAKGVLPRPYRRPARPDPFPVGFVPDP